MRANQRSRRVRLMLWAFIVLYVAMLPYAIVLFDFLEGLLGLRVVRVLPLIVLLVFCVIYLWGCRIKGRGYGVISFILPSLVMFVGVFLLESNSIKYIHIPEYALLTGLIYLAISRDHHNVVVLVVSAIYASALGVFDEVHHGMHPGRYLGWKDMIINCVGSAIGALGISVFGNFIVINISEDWRPLKHELIMLIITTVVTFISLVKLFEVAQHSNFSYAYSSPLLVANLVSILMCLVIVLRNYRNIENNLVREFVLFFPALILMAIHILICISYFLDLKFQ